MQYFLKFANRIQPYKCSNSIKNKKMQVLLLNFFQEFSFSVCFLHSNIVWFNKIVSYYIFTYICKNISDDEK